MKPDIKFADVKLAMIAGATLECTMTVLVLGFAASESGVIRHVADGAAYFQDPGGFLAMKIFRSAVLREIGGHYRSQIFEYSVVYVMEALVMIIQATIFSTLTMALIYLSRLRRKRGTVHEPVGEKL